jgi:lipopolysaccharide/colanic/teichoic acid biosynthesis glycosyltransferase
MSKLEVKAFFTALYIYIIIILHIKTDKHTLYIQQRIGRSGANVWTQAGTKS